MRAAFKVLYEVDIRGIENVPKDGPVIIAYNHTNVFDGPFLLAFTPRPLRFIVAAFALKVPFWGIFLKLYGAIPVRRGTADFSAIRSSIGVLEEGGGFAIAPEGTYTTDGHMVPAKQGTALIALKTGAPIVPATITGAFRSWPSLGPQKRRVPRPWRLGLTFHEPIRITPEEMARHKEDKAFEKELTQRIVDSLNRTLEPSLRAEARIDHLVKGRAPRIRLYEFFPLFLILAAGILLGARTGWFLDPAMSARALKFLVGFLAIGLAYFIYLGLDMKASRQTVLTRAFRGFSPFLFLALYYPLLVRYIPFVTEVRGGAVAAYPGWLAAMPPPLCWIIVDWLFLTYFVVFPCLLLDLRYYYFHRHLLFQRYVRGFLLCIYAALLLIVFVPAVGSAFPLAVPLDVMGLFSPLLSRFHMSRLALGAFPSVIVTLTSYCLVFDFLNHRSSFHTLLFPAASGVAAAVFLHGYPLSAVGINVLVVILIMLYMRMVPITSHDGRRI
ncbi:MAG: 1-acyl-sn-glycerol-3-phosphate acyltransferase [Candidatus Tritonobacter lacicola]|nr:1-acyl-sn-glycerol-3-phosphate acyltransferase [Candidatus Tritonobacter lacicola]